MATSPTSASNTNRTLPLLSLEPNQPFINLSWLSGVGSGPQIKHPNVILNKSEHIDRQVHDDEQSLLRDAQTALIAHQSALAIQYYTTAALPPYRSPRACLALGILLSDGAGSLPIPHSFLGFLFGPGPSNHKLPPPRQSVPESSRTTGSKLLSFLFQPNAPSPTIHDSLTSILFRLRDDLASNQRSLDQEDETAVRDVEGMRNAGEWLVLGLAWILEAEAEAERAAAAAANSAEVGLLEEDEGAGLWRRADKIPPMTDGGKEEDSEIITVKSHKALSRTTFSAPSTSISTSTSTSASASTTIEASSPRESSPSNSPHKKTSLNRPHTVIAPSPTSDMSASPSSSTPPNCAVGSEEGTVAQTPKEKFAGLPTEGGSSQGNSRREALELSYALLQPLLDLYQTNQIQPNDRLHFPPIPSCQIPQALAGGDKEEIRNTWALGRVVVRKLLDSGLLREPGMDGERGSNGVTGESEVEGRRRGVLVLGNYLLGMTDPENPDVYFRTVVHLGECGLASADELVRQAAQRLDKVSLTPEISLSLGKGRTAGEMAEKSYAFPQTTPDRSSSKNVESPANEPVDNAQPSSSRQTDISRLRHHRPTSSRSSINPKCHGRKTSTTSLSSFSLISTTPGMARPKSTISLASLTTTYENEVCLENEGDARGCLRGVLAAASIPTSASASAPGGGDDVEGGSGDDGNVWPSLARWTIGTGPTNISPPSTHGSTSTLVENETFPRREVIHPDKPVIQIIKPTIGRSTPAPHLRTTSSSSSPDLPSFFKSKSRLQFKKHTNHLSTSTLPLPRPSSSTLLQAHHQTQINPIDPKLAAAELSSALTKHVSCSMCGLEGVNFPECRKCGMRFCSRGCRIGVGKGGDGRRHVCKGLREGEAEVSLRGEGEMERAELRGKEVGVVC